MSSINSVGSGSSTSAAAYQEYLARLQAQKQADGQNQASQANQPASNSPANVDHDGDSR